MEMQEYKRQNSRPEPESQMMEKENVRESLREMCCCLKSKKPCRFRSKLHALLCGWYVPRNERDAESFMRRYSVWRKLPTLVAERIEREEDDVL